MRIPTIVLLAAAAFAAAAAPASATVTTSLAAGTLTVTSDGASDSITVTCVASALVVTGAAPTGAPCSGGLTVLGNGGDDAADVSALEGLPITPVSIDGGPGDDALTGVVMTSNGREVALAGGPGNDTLTSNVADTIRGGTGNDRIIGPAQDGGTLSGEDGTDTFALALPGVMPTSFTFTPTATGLTISQPPSSALVPFASIEVVDLVLDDGAQTVDGSAFPGTLRVDARGGADTITGTSGADVLNGGAGNDFVDGRGGADILQGGPGLDLLHARDGVADTADCGEEDDTVQADAADVLVACERIDLPVVAAPPDTVAPALRFRKATLTGRRIKLPVSCPAGETRCAGVLTLAGTGRRKGDRVRVGLGAVTFQLAGGKSRTLTRRIAKAKARKLRRLRTVKLRISLEVVDAAGNRATGVKRVGLRR